MPTPDEILTIGVGLESREATQAWQKFQRNLLKEFQKVGQGVENLGKVNKKVAKVGAGGAKEWKTELGDLAKYYQGDIDKIKALEKSLKRLKKAQDRAAKAGDPKAAKAAKAQAKAVQKELKSQTGALKAKALPGFDTKKLADESKSAMKEAGRALTGTVSSFFSKDIKGILTGAGGFGSSLAKSAVKGLASSSGKLTGVGHALGARGAAKGGKVGGAMGAAGSGLKHLGSLTKGLGGAVGALAKIGPILGMIGTGMMALIQLFIDVEAKAKGFQKDLLQSASTIEVLGKAGWDADYGFDKLKNTVKEIRESAFDAKFNLAWGTTADDHKAVLNALNQEGISINRIEEEAGKAGKTVGAFSQDLVKVGIAYSRAFGVPIQEINRQQAELMTELGQSADEVEMGFAKMARSAEESGIASNKFFSIIRGVSQDLSLYNLRMGDAVKLLTQMGKVMNPRNAQKFMSVATRGLKDMGRTERLRLTMLAGGEKTKNLVNKDMNRKTQYLGRKLGMDPAEVAKIMATEGAKGLRTAIEEKVPKEAQGALTEMAMKLQLQQTRSKKGTFGMSGAAADLSPGAALELRRAAVLSRTGFTSIKDAVGSIGAEMMAENLGISQEEMDQSAQFEMSMEMERERMIDLLGRQVELNKRTAEAAAGGKALTDKEKEEIASLKAMTDAGLTTTADVTKAGYDQLFEGMTESDKKAAKDAQKVTNYAKQQTELTTTLTKKLEILADFIMNQLYNIFIDIWDTLSDIPGLGGDKGARKAKIAAMRAGGASSEVGKAMAVDSTGNVRETVGSTEIFQKMLEVMKDSGKTQQEEIEKLRAEIAEGPVPGDIGSEMTAEMLGISQKEMDKQLEKRKRLKELDAKQEERGRMRTRAFNILNADMENQKKHGGAAGESMKNAVHAALGSSPEIDEKMRVARQAMYQKNQSFDQSLAMAGFNEEEIGKVMANAMHWQTSDQQLAGGAAEFEKYYKEQQETADKTAEESVKTAKATQDLANEGVKKKSSLYVRFGDSFLNGKYKDAIKKAVLDAVRTALFEYYLYSDLDKESVIKTMGKEGLDAVGFSEALGKGAGSRKMPGDIFKDLGTTAGGKDALKPPGKQHGGTVSHISQDGLAIFRRPPGEGVTGIRPGERIVPAYGGSTAGGGGGGTGSTTKVLIDLAPAAQKLIQTEVQHGIYEHERRKRTAG